MAIDTATKRNSALIDTFGILIPDGTIDAEDRATLVGQYGGIAAVAPPESDLTTGEQSAFGSDIFRIVTRQTLRLG